MRSRGDRSRAAPVLVRATRAGGLAAVAREVGLALELPAPAGLDLRPVGERLGDRASPGQAGRAEHPSVLDGDHQSEDEQSVADAPLDHAAFLRAAGSVTREEEYRRGPSRP